MLLETTSPRERSGSQTSARYDFQTNFAILKLVELREGAEDFRVIVDLFDDLTILDSALAPTAVRFYQIKSKDAGDWIMSELCKKVGGKAPRSIVSRLYAHLPAFGAAVVETAMVSNAAYRLTLMDGTVTSGAHHRIEGIELHADEVTKVVGAVTADINPADVPGWLPKLAFIRTSLGVHDQQLLVIGRLQKHVEEFERVEGVRVSSVYEALHASITQKTGFSREGTESKEILDRKSLSKAELDELFKRAISRGRGVLEDWEIIQSDLEKSGVPSIAQIKLKTAAIAYKRDRNAGRPDALLLTSFVEQWILTHAEQINACATLPELAQVFQKALPETFGFDDRHLRAALLVEAYEAVHDSA
jgi:Cap4 dsDNA endonuclease